MKISFDKLLRQKHQMITNGFNDIGFICFQKYQCHLDFFVLVFVDLIPSLIKDRFHLLSSGQKG